MIAVLKKLSLYVLEGTFEILTYIFPVVPKSYNLPLELNQTTESNLGSLW